MKYLFILCAALLLLCRQGAAQTTAIAVIRDQATQQPLAGATLRISNRQFLSNTQGRVFLPDIAPGKHLLSVQYAGFESYSDSFLFPLTDTLRLFLEATEEDMEEVVVQSTRTSRTIQNTPTRIETIGGEELDEKNNMRPANVSMLLHESTGIRVQQTSATSANASIRIQGLDGRYTQLLKDGYPNFGAFASGLSILEIPPLDLQQVEVIKGPASTLYGGGAIAGVVNFISKQPKATGDYQLLLNQSHIGQTNFGGYASKRNARLGYSLLATLNLQQAYDVDKDDFSELPRSRDFTINPTFYFYPSAHTTISIGNSFTKGSRTGGDMFAIKNDPNPEHTFFEKNRTLRNTSTLSLQTKLSDVYTLVVKQSLSLFNRQIDIPAYTFKGHNLNSFSEVSLAGRFTRHTLVAGLNYVHDDFRQREPVNRLAGSLDAVTRTAGIYVQDTWDATPYLSLETGLRADHLSYTNELYTYRKAFLLPRVSALFRLSGKLTSRIGAGLGYKAPTVFTEQSESFYYRDLQPLYSATKAEKSLGVTADVNYRTTLAHNLQLSVNQLFFYTRINDPLVLDTATGYLLYFHNSADRLDSKGFETNLKLIYRQHLKLFAGFTYTLSQADYFRQRRQPLTPAGQLNLALIYEKEKQFKLGLEAYRTSGQYLYNGTQVPAYWECGFMAEKTWGPCSVFINFENFTDTRQSRYKQVANPPHNNPTFDDIWTHVEGFVMNGGIKIRL